MYQLLCEFEFEGKPWEKHELYWDRSPIAHITAASTPMLLTHGEQVSLCMMHAVHLFTNKNRPLLLKIG